MATGLLACAIGFRVRFMSGRNGVNPAEPAMKIDVGAAFRTKRAGGKNGGLAADRAGSDRCFVRFFIKPVFRFCN